MTLPVLAALLDERAMQEAKQAYQATLLWQIGVQLAAMNGQQDRIMPDYYTLFPLRQAVASAQSIHSRILRVLNKAERRKEHGRS